jgi:hypothetical protein
MQAILKSKHQRFCNWLQKIKDKQQTTGSALDDLENEMVGYYNMYVQKREELRTIILHYEEKQKAIRNRIRQNRTLNSLSSNQEVAARAME